MSTSPSVVVFVVRNGRRMLPNGPVGGCQPGVTGEYLPIRRPTQVSPLLAFLCRLAALSLAYGGIFVLDLD